MLWVGCHTAVCVLQLFQKYSIEKMDFPDQEEEYEMMYADELEVMREMEGKVATLYFINAWSDWLPCQEVMYCYRLKYSG